MNKEEEQAANENHTSQSDMNEKVLTQNGCSTPKEVGTLDKDDTKRAEK